MKKITRRTMSDEELSGLLAQYGLDHDGMPPLEKIAKMKKLTRIGLDPVTLLIMLLPIILAE